MGKDSSTFTHSWENLQAKKCEEPSCFYSRMQEAVFYPAPQQQGVSLLPLKIREPKTTQITGCFLQVLQGHLGETSPTSYFADEKNLRPWRPPVSKKLHLQPGKVCQPLGTDTWGGVLSLPLSFSRAPPRTPACPPPQASSPRQHHPAGVFTLTPLSWRWGPSIFKSCTVHPSSQKTQMALSLWVTD